MHRPELGVCHVRVTDTVLARLKREGLCITANQPNSWVVPGRPPPPRPATFALTLVILPPEMLSSSFKASSAFRSSRSSSSERWMVLLTLPGVLSFLIVFLLRFEFIATLVPITQLAHHSLLA